MKNVVNNFLSFAERKKFNTNYYMEHIAYLRSGWLHLNSITEEARLKAKELEEGLHLKKPAERQHQEDRYGRDRRFKFGPRCEAKCKEALNTLSTFDTSVGDSRLYGGADFKKLGIGVKSSQFGSCAMVFRYPKRPEIIMSYTDAGDFYVCGLATVDIMKKYSSMDRLNDINPALKRIEDDPKLGFYGYAHLIPLHDHFTIPKLKALLKTV